MGLHGSIGIQWLPIRVRLWRKFWVSSCGWLGRTYRYIRVPHGLLKSSPTSVCCKFGFRLGFGTLKLFTSLQEALLCHKKAISGSMDHLLELH